jgi:hypothetical protein
MIPGKAQASSKSAATNMKGVTEWASAKDPKTDRTYYYNIRTKETTWNKVSNISVFGT